MTTNQTIDGVPRELLEQLLTLAAMSASAPYRELRALLDSPVCGTPSGDQCPGDGVGRCKKCPAAQPQGEPVAWTEFDALDFMTVALRHAEYSGLASSDILDGLRYMAEKGRPAFQPAPVAVASRDESIYWLKRIDGIGQARAELIYSMGFRRHTEVPQS